jgi:hypothetical protein
MLTRLVLMSAVVLATSSIAKAEVIQKDKFKGAQVATAFDGSAEIDCGGGVPGTITVSGSMTGATSVSRTKGQPKTVTNGMFADIFYSNSCTGEFRIISGGASNVVDAPNRNLRSAAIEGTTTLQDFNDGTTFAFAFDVEFDGIGEVFAAKDRTRTKTQDTPHGPVTITHTFTANANRSATATGTIAIGGVEMTPTFSFAIMSWNANGTKVIER